MAVACPHGEKNLADRVNRSAAGCNREAMDDDLLIAAIAAGDDTAVRGRVSLHAPWLAARLRSALPAPDVEDVLQETFLAVWRGAGGYRPEGAAGGWLWGGGPRQGPFFLPPPGPAGIVLPAVIGADRRQAADPAEAAVSRADIDGAVDVLGPVGSPDR